MKDLLFGKQDIIKMTKYMGAVSLADVCLHYDFYIT